MKIKLENIKLSFGEKIVLNDISFEIEDFKNVAILGYNGSGKETLLKLLSGIIEQDKGKYFINNFEINPDIRKNISYVFQYGGLISNLTVKENLLLPLNFHQPEVSLKEKLKKIHQNLTEFSIYHTLDLRPAELTIEEYKLINYIRAVITSPELLLLHEPLSLCDIPVVNRIIEDIKINSGKKRMQIFVCQSNNLLLKLANEFIILDEGKIIYKGKLNEIKNNDNIIVQSIYNDFLGDIPNET